MVNDDITPAAVRFAAMNLLSMREHSALELSRKLSKKYQQDELVAAVIKRLTEDGLQSDARFAEAFINMRKRQGKGPLIVCMELKERGVSAELINDLLNPDNDSWKLLAVAVRQKKFGEPMPGNVKEGARQMRFLAMRGFSSACIQYALKYAHIDDHSD